MHKKQTSTDCKKLIIKLWNDGSSIRDIARNIRKASSTIHYVIKKYRERKSVDRPTQPGSGRRRILNEPQIRQKIFNYVKESGGFTKVSAVQIAKELKNCKLAKVSAQTVRNFLQRELNDSEDETLGEKEENTVHEEEETDQEEEKDIYHEEEETDHEDETDHEEETDHKKEEDIDHEEEKIDYEEEDTVHEEEEADHEEDAVHEEEETDNEEETDHEEEDTAHEDETDHEEETDHKKEEDIVHEEEKIDYVVKADYEKEADHEEEDTVHEGEGTTQEDETDDEDDYIWVRIKLSDEPKYHTFTHKGEVYVWREDEALDLRISKLFLNIYISISSL